MKLTLAFVFLCMMNISGCAYIYGRNQDLIYEKKITAAQKAELKNTPQPETVSESPVAAETAAQTLSPLTQ